MDLSPAGFYARQAAPRPALVYSIAAVGLFFIAGEELAWGQLIFGMVGEARHTPRYVLRCEQQWTIEEISQDEFEAVWKASETAPNQPQKYDPSSFTQVPEELSDEMTPERIQRLPLWIAGLFDRES